MNYKVVISATFYTKKFEYEYDDYGEALEKFCAAVSSSAEMIAICMGEIINISLLDSTGNSKKLVTLSSIGE